MTTPTRILLSDDLYALEEEDDVREHYTYCTCPTCLDAKTIPTAPGAETPRQLREPSPLLGFIAAGISGAVVGAVVMALVLT